MSKIELNLKPNHIHGNFEWEKEPDCSCGQIADAIENKIIFVSDVSDQGATKLYMLPLHDDGYHRLTGGVEIAYCPWCVWG